MCVDEVKAVAEARAIYDEYNAVIRSPNATGGQQTKNRIKSLIVDYGVSPAILRRSIANYRVAADNLHRSPTGRFGAKTFWLDEWENYKDSVPKSASADPPGESAEALEHRKRREQERIDKLARGEVA